MRLPSLLTERLPAVLTQVGGVALTLWQRGPAAAWQAISQQAGDLKAQALDFVQAQVLGVAARAVPVFLATLAVPGGAFVQVARGIYNGVMTFVEKGRQIAQVGTALLGSLSAIAAGQLAPAAQAVETTLVKVLPVALSFLAKWLGLDGISGAIQTGLRKVQVPVEKAVTKVLDTVVDKAKALWDAVKTGAGKAVDQGRQVAAAVGDKVAGWLGLRKPFTTPEGEQHTLYFSAQGLMVASNPTSYHEFILAMEKQLRKQPVPVPATQQALEKAKSLAKGIDRLTLRSEQQDGVDKAVQIGLLLEELAPFTTVLMQAGGTISVGASSDPVFGGLTSGGFGRGMHMAYLTSATSSGTKANGKNNKVYTILNQRSSGGGAYYVQGHLLSEKLHGTGKDWQNLTPLTNLDNGEHERKVEAPLKEAFKVGHPRAFIYSVTPTYGRGVNQGLINQLAPAERISPQHTDAQNDATREAIIRAEQYVPVSLVCTIEEVNPADRTKKVPPVGDVPAKVVVSNTIDQSSPRAYQLGRIKAVSIETKTSSLLTGLGLTQQEADGIIAAGGKFANKTELYKQFPYLNHAIVDALVARRYLKFK